MRIACERLSAVNKQHIFFILCAEVLSHMIRKDNLIKGILIQNKEYKLV